MSYWPEKCPMGGFCDGLKLEILDNVVIARCGEKLPCAAHGETCSKKALEHHLFWNPDALKSHRDALAVKGLVPKDHDITAKVRAVPANQGAEYAMTDEQQLVWDWVRLP